MTPETKVKHLIGDYLDSVPDLWHVAYHNMGYGRRGVPDRLICYRGRFIALEIKKNEKADATEWQKREIKAITEAGGDACVVWSVEQVRELIEHIGRTC